MSVMIAKCTPSLGFVSIWWARLNEALIWPNNMARGIFYVRDGVGGEIAEARNVIVESCLEYSRTQNKISHLFWVDDDVLIQEGALLELLHQEADICSGVYFTKLPGNLSSPLIYPERCGGTAPFRPDQVINDVWGHGMGLCLVRREVYESMEKDGNLGKDKYGRPMWYHTTDLMKEVKRDETGCIDGGSTEDTYFLDRAHKLGYKSTVVTTKHAFGWHYDAKADLGYPEAQWKQWVAGEPVKWKTPQGEVIWD